MAREGGVINRNEVWCATNCHRFDRRGVRDERPRARREREGGRAGAHQHHGLVDHDGLFVAGGLAELDRRAVARDRDGDPVFMAKSPWDVGYQQEKNPELVFSATKER